MATADSDMVQCNTCGTTYPASDTAEAANHVGHDTVHIEQG